MHISHNNPVPSLPFTNKQANDSKTEQKPTSAYVEVAADAQSMGAAKEQRADKTEPESLGVKLGEIMNKIIDYNVGIDREKLEEIEARIKAIQNDNNISDEQKAELIEALRKEQITLLKKSEQRMAENEGLGFENTPDSHAQANELFDALMLDKRTPPKSVLIRQSGS